MADNNRKLALIIGNGSYEVLLKNPVNDAKDVSRKLQSLGFEVETLTNASKRQMRSAVHNLVERASDYDAILFYYTGHGLQVKGENYLVPVDATMGYESDAEFECENLNHVLANLSESDCRMKIVDERPVKGQSVKEKTIKSRPIQVLRTKIKSSLNISQATAIIPLYRLTNFLNSYSVNRDISCAKIVLSCNLLKFKLLNNVGGFFSGH